MLENWLWMEGGKEESEELKDAMEIMAALEREVQELKEMEAQVSRWKCLTGGAIATVHIITTIWLE